MNTLKLQMADGTAQEIPVLQLASEGMKINISADGRAALKRMAESSVHVESRNDAGNLLWLVTFAPALLGILAQHEHAVAMAVQKQVAEEQQAIADRAAGKEEL